MTRNSRRNQPAPSSKMSAWFLHHLQSLVSSLGKICQSPGSSIMTVAVIGITLSLPAGFYLFLKNIDAMSGEFRSTTKITLYLDMGLSEKKARALDRRIASKHGVGHTEFLSSEASLESFRQTSGFGKSIDTLAHNPLPHVIIVEPAEGTDTPRIKGLSKSLEAEPGVKIAKLDTEWLERLYAILEIAQRSVLMITVLFTFAVLLIIGNTIRLDIQNRYQEIIITKLIGATNAFIRRPFLYGGLWYGLLGGLFCWVIVEVGYMAITDPLNRLRLLYQTDLVLVTFSFQDFVILTSSSALLGLIGSWIAVARHMKQIEPA